MEFCILSGGAKGVKFRVPAVKAVYAGTYDETSRETLRPCRAAIAAAIPYRWRKAFERTDHMWWFSDGSRFDGRRFIGDAPKLYLRDLRGRLITVLYALPCADEVQA